ncbi:MAG TPA: BON domain-containing protein [Candidatus Dormibacteraeota bacterium]|nr:BON domain-containing protein [Candidatus Dormibacteraeota bacterium]
MSRRWWIGAGILAAVSALGAYFFDPDNGKARRIKVLERSSHITRTTTRRVARESRYVLHTLRGRGRHLVAPEPQEFADGRTLLDRVESEVFADRSIPHGRLNFEVDGTTVILRGELDSGGEMFRVEEAVRKVPGVTDVKSLLHLPGTPAPNKAAALAASVSRRRTRSKSPKEDA